jgi:peptidoglycan hydrolase-like protein with peptidoglycan-binding domain
MTRRGIIARGMPPLLLLSAVLLVACGTANPTRTADSTPAVVLPEDSDINPPASAPDPTTTAPAPPAPALLKVGSTGPAVLAVQERLSALGYWVGEPNGTFGDSTQQAVFALQKVAGLTRDGVVGPSTSAALDQGAVPRPRSTSGRVIEIDLSDDVMMIVANGKLDATLNTSTGGGYRYVSRGVTSVATTPTGIFHVVREVNGTSTGPLGQLWRPKFFFGGYAIHGAASVPPYPASHGCARLSNEAMNWIWADNLAPIGTEVWVY